MKKNILVLLCTLIFADRTFSQSFNPALANMLNDTLSFYTAQIPSIKGLSTEVHIPSQGTWQGTAGINYGTNPITNDMVFGIASNTKLFVSVVLLKLQQSGLINLDDSIQSWLPPYQNINPHITIRQLLNHSSGIADPVFVSPWIDTLLADPERIFTAQEVIGWTGPPLFAPGTAYAYSNINYILAGLIAENASSYPIYQLIRDSLLNVLNLNHTFYDVEEAETGTIAHRWWNGIDYHDTSRIALNTAGGCAGALFSNTEDMIKWYQAVFNSDFLNEISKQQLTTFIPTGSPTQKSGLGLMWEQTQGLSYYTHGGTTWGYRSKMIIDSCSNVTVAALSNSFPSGMDAVCFMLYRVVFNHIPGCIFELNGPDSVCAGNTEYLFSSNQATNAANYVWNLDTGITGNSSTHSIALTFDSALGGHWVNIQVTAENSFGFGGSMIKSVYVKSLPPTPFISQSNDTLFSSNALGNQWYNSAGILTGDTLPYLYPVLPGNSYYCISKLQNCFSDTSNVLSIMPVHNSRKSVVNEFNLFPNPANDLLEINPCFQNYTISIYNLQGTKMLESNSVCTIDIKNLPPGFYILYSQHFVKSFCKL